jgi:hypothetical protein
MKRMLRITNLIIFLVVVLISCDNQKKSGIDRYALVQRHNIKLTAPDTLASLTVGNGNFAFTTDITGLQTFYGEYEKGMPLGTQSNWGWHSNPNVNNYTREECDRWFSFQGRQVPYQHQLNGGRGEGASNYFRENPHRLHLGMIRLVVTKKDGSQITLDDLQSPVQELDMWTGQIKSTFQVEGVPVTVETYCHQDIDMVSCNISSELIKTGQLAIEYHFPFAVAQNTHAGYDFDQPDKHNTEFQSIGDNSAKLHRMLDTNQYFTYVAWEQPSKFIEVEKHRFHLVPDKENSKIAMSCLFTPNASETALPGFETTKANNLSAWEQFWMSGGAVDFSACKDKRAYELERRTVLSQYLIQVQSSGNVPPAETGLTYNSWYGKFHLEMHWWHSVHFALWGRPQYLENQMGYYERIASVSRDVAQRQGFAGLRWPKMVGLHGMNSPSSVGSYLVWQQPHYIYFAELLYRENPELALERYSGLVFETAEFMFDFLQYDPVEDDYNMLPPLIPAQEHWDRETATNPPFELSQFHWTLQTAIEWKKRMGQEADPQWQVIVDKLALPQPYQGVYLGIEGATDSYTNPEQMRDHPMVLGAYGMLPLWDAMDIEVMKNTLDTILAHWDWPSTWGWDYPMAAMNAIRLGEPETAINVLLMDVQKNTYLVNGHNYQSPRLRVYLPGNGGFLTTMALMCAGWEGHEGNNPGFPNDGNWDVNWEGLKPMF